MAILDIFNEVTEKNIVKSETGDPRIFGVLIGEVTNNYSMECIKMGACSHAKLGS